MFTGIIQAVGKVIKYDGKRCWISTPFRTLRIGESIAVEGVCLTLAARKGRTLAFDVGRETQRITTLGTLTAGSPVNLERSLRVGDRLGGHWVSGHVEETGRIQKIEKARLNIWLTIGLPTAVAKYVRAKGSIAIDGISLTVAGIKKGNVRIMIIPHTWKKTTLKNKQKGDRVNLEADLLAKYVIR